MAQSSAASLLISVDSLFTTPTMNPSLSWWTPTFSVNEPSLPRKRLLIKRSWKLCNTVAEVKCRLNTRVACPKIGRKPCANSEVCPLDQPDPGNPCYGLITNENRERICLSSPGFTFTEWIGNHAAHTKSDEFARCHQKRYKTPGSPLLSGSDILLQ